MIDKHSQKAYLPLIDTLLKNSSDMALEILNANHKLIDIGLVKMMEQVAKVMIQQNHQNAADYLIHIAEQLSKALNSLDSVNGDNQDKVAVTGDSAESFRFLMQVLQTTSDSNADAQIIYPLLQANLEKLNQQLGFLLNSWSMNTLPKVERGEAQFIAATIAKFSDLISNFPLGSRANNLNIALTGYAITTTVFTHEAFPETWVELQNSFKRTLLMRLFQEVSDCNGNYQRVYSLLQANLEQLDDGFIKVFNEWTAATFSKSEPEKTQAIAAVVAEFSNIIQQFPLGNRNTMEIAIAGYKISSNVLNYGVFPKQWAENQTNLGIAYCERIYGDPIENLEAAIHCYKSALQVFTREEFPQDWAWIQINLGTAYHDTNNIEAAINCYEAALKVCKQEEFPDKFAIIQNNLGNAYCNRLQDNSVEDLEKAISCYQKVLQVHTYEKFPHDWATAQTNLGSAYCKRVLGEKLQNLDLAIVAFDKALQVHTREAFPQKWMTIQNNLGNAFHQQEQIDKAIECYRLALEVCKPDSFPIDCFQAGSNLGNMTFIAERWEEAIEGYGIAIEAIEQSRTWASTDFRKQEILSEAIHVYENMVIACIKNCNLSKALAYVERSKTRNLVDLITNRDLCPKGNISQTVLEQLQQLRQKIIVEQRHLEIKLRNRNSGLGSQECTVTLSSLDRTYLYQLQQQLEQLIQREILPHDPTFSLTQKVDAITFDQIQQLLPDNQTAAIEWFIVGQKFLTFIVTKQNKVPIVWESALQDLEALTSWANNYFMNYNPESKQWQVELNERLQQLAEILHIDYVISLLPETCKHLIVIPHRFLHLFPLHALHLANGLCLLDRFPSGIRYAPSCQLLQIAQNQKRPYFQKLFAIQNPADDLHYANVEVTAICSSFPVVQVLVKQESTKIAIQTSQDLASSHCCHFSCHGTFNAQSPLESSLLLANDERLTLEEIFSLNLSQCRLVTLSACETGLIDPSSISDEYVGLPSGFLYAGSLSVVSSLWAVDDLSTALLMIKFYDNLQTGQSVAIALNQAQLWLRDVTKAELRRWVEENRFRLKPSVSINLRRWFNQLKNDAQPFREPQHWAAFCAIG